MYGKNFRMHFNNAKDPEVGPITGWPPHKNVEESKNVIRNVLNGAECYAICRKENNIAIGSIELILNSHTDMTERDDECELGYSGDEAICRKLPVH